MFTLKKEILKKVVDIANSGLFSETQLIDYNIAVQFKFFGPTTEVIYTIPKQGLEDNKTVIPSDVFEVISVAPREFADTLKMFDTAIFEITENKLNISNDNVVATLDKLKSTYADLISKMPIIDNIINIPAKDFLQTLSKVAYATTKDCFGVSALQNIYCYTAGNTLITVASDGYRLAEYRTNVVNVGNKDAQFYVHNDQFKLLKKLLNTKDYLSITISDVILIDFRTEDLQILLKQTKDKYPDYKKAIAKEDKYKTTAVFNKAEVLKILKQSKHAIAKIIFNRTSFYLEILNGQKNKTLFKIKIPAQVDGELQTIVFNVDYLLDALKNTSKNEIILSIINDHAPAYIEPQDAKNELHVILPILL